jgi:hypothetical protein
MKTWTLAFALAWACQPAAPELDVESPEPQAVEPAMVEAPTEGSPTGVMSMEEATAVGQTAVKQTGGALKEHLITALAEYPVYDAVGYCQTIALPVTDTAAHLEGVQVRRTALRYRNPANAPTEKEMAVLKMFESGASVGEMTVDEGHYFGYYMPIKMDGLCLNCHGDVRKDIQPATLQAIQKRYPNDQATGFVAGELRGIWSVAIPKKKQQP